MQNYPSQYPDMQFSGNVHFTYHFLTAKFVFIGEHLRKLFGIAEEDLSEEAIIEYVEPSDLKRARVHVAKLIAGKGSGSIEMRISHPNGTRWIRFTPLLIGYESDHMLLGNIDDVTDMVLNQETINKYANKKNSMLQTVSHDLRGPLNIAKNIIDLVAKEHTKEGILKKTNYVATVLQDSINLISNLISREFLETTEVVLYKKRIDIVKKTSEYLEEYRKSTTIDRAFLFNTSHDSLLVDIDEGKLMQVINNLMSNALKFTAPGGEIAVEIALKEEMIELTFSDNGVGIPKNLLPVIFDKYTSAGRIGLSGEPTTGLGLSIVKRIVEWHHGKISCTSIENSGTTFQITFPQFSIEP